MKKWKTTVTLALAAALVTALHLSVNRTGSWDSTPALAALPLRDGLFAAGGLVEPASEARQLSATVVGRITKVNFEEGDRVAAGQPIAEIENRELKAQLAAAEATQIVRASELERLRAGAREQQIAEARAAVNEAEAMAVVARQNYERRKALGDKQNASLEAIQQALAAQNAAQSRRVAMAERLALLIAPPRAEDLAIAQANVDVARARVMEISAQIDKTIIQSPIDGVVLKLHHRAGETVTNLPPTPIATIGDRSKLHVRADVDEADVARVFVGQTVSVTADAYRDQRFRGTVARISGQLGRKNFRSDTPEEKVDAKILEVLIDLDDAPFPIGLRVDVTFEAPSKKQVSANVAPAAKPGRDAAGPQAALPAESRTVPDSVPPPVSSLVPTAPVQALPAPEAPAASDVAPPVSRLDPAPPAPVTAPPENRATTDAIPSPASSSDPIAPAQPAATPDDKAASDAGPPPAPRLDPIEPERAVAPPDGKAVSDVAPPADLSLNSATPAE